MTPSRRYECERLVSLLVDDALDAAEHARLESLLRDDPECRDFYLEYIDLHCRLSSHPALVAAIDAAAHRDPGSSLLPTAVAASQTSLPARRWISYGITAVLTLAASVALQLWLTQPQPDRVRLIDPPLTAAVVESSVPDYVATLSKAVDCEWEGDELLLGTRLLPGDISLRRGMAEVRFDGGAQLVLRGPAKLDVESVTSAKVESGEVLFYSDDSTEPFELETPLARLVDYGTEYAVAVSSLGEEIHVFDGEVLRTPCRRDSAAEPQSVVAGQARRFEPAGDCGGWEVPIDVERLRIRASTKRTIATTPSNDDPALLVYEPFACVGKSLPAVDIGRCGRGFASPWVKSCKSELPIEFRLVDSLWRPQMVFPTKGGGVSASCRGAMSRTMAQPLRMDRDGVYYFTLLVRSERRAGSEACDMQLSLRDHRNRDPHRKLAVSASWSSSKASLCWEGGGNCASLPMEAGKTYLLAGKIVAGREAPDQAFFRLFSPRQSVSFEEPMSWTIASRPVLSDSVYDTIQISANTSTPVMIDELRIGKSWQAVAEIYATR